MSERSLERNTFPCCQTVCGDKRKAVGKTPEKEKDDGEKERG